MLYRVVFSFGLACGLAAAADQPLEGLLNTSNKSLQACTHQALENAVSAARQKKIAKENKLEGGVNWADVFGPGNRRLDASVRRNPEPTACSIPLTQMVIPPGTRFELKRIHPLDNRFDPFIVSPPLPVCR